MVSNLFVSTSDLDLSAGTQLRAGMDKNAIEEYAESYRENGIEVLGPIHVFEVDGVWVIIDGFHRVTAALLAYPDGVMMPCISSGKGTIDDAILRAAAANWNHGVRRTDADKRCAVLRILSNPEWVKWSDVKIAQTCKVGNRIVGVLRRELAAVQSDQALPARLASLPIAQVEQAAATIRESDGTRIVERGNQIYEQQPRTPKIQDLPDEEIDPMARPAQPLKRPSLDSLRIYCGQPIRDTKGRKIMEDGEIVTLESLAPNNKGYDVGIGRGSYLKKVEVAEKLLRPINLVIGDTVPWGSISAPITDYQVSGGTSIELKFEVDWGEQGKTFLSFAEITALFVEAVEVSRSSEPSLQLEDVMLPFHEFFQKLTNLQGYSLQQFPVGEWPNPSLLRVVDFREELEPEINKLLIDVAIVSQFATNLSDLIANCRQIIVTPWQAVVLFYTPHVTQISQAYSPELGPLKI
jgi:hypothetical protein